MFTFSFLLSTFCGLWVKSLILRLYQYHQLCFTREEKSEYDTLFKVPPFYGKIQHMLNEEADGEGEGRSEFDSHVVLVLKVFVSFCKPNMCGFTFECKGGLDYSVPTLPLIQFFYVIYVVLKYLKCDPSKIKPDP